MSDFCLLMVNWHWWTGHPSGSIHQRAVEMSSWSLKCWCWLWPWCGCVDTGHLSADFSSIGAQVVSYEEEEGPLKSSERRAAAAHAFDLWRRVDVVLSFSDWVMVVGWQLLSRPPWFVAFVKSPQCSSQQPLTSKARRTQMRTKRRGWRPTLASSFLLMIISFALCYCWPSVLMLLPCLRCTVGSSRLCQRWKKLGKTLIFLWLFRL